MAIANNNETNKLTTKRLSIQIGLSGLSFCILDVSANTITYFKQFKKERNLTPLELLDYLKFVIDTEGFKQKNFDQILVIYRNELSTLVPKLLFDEDNLADYIKFNNKILPTDFITFDELNDDIINVYVPLVNINNFIYDTFGAFVYKHFSTVFIEQVKNRNRNFQEKRMYVNVEDSLFETLVLDGDKLIYSNTFSFNTKEDFIYYILFTSEQLKMNTENFPLFLYGEIDETSEFFEIAYKYIRHVAIGKLDLEYKIQPELNDSKINYVLANSFT